MSVSVSKKRKLNDKSVKVKKVEKAQAQEDAEASSSSEVESDIESGSDASEDDNDELDLDQVSSSDGSDDDEASEEDKVEEEEEDDSFPRKKKSSKSKHDDGSSTFSSALTNILSSHLKAYDRKDPIMARNKRVIKQNEADKLEQKAKKAILAEKKKLLNKTRKKEIIPVAAADTNAEEIREVLEKERKLRRIAQKGVVKLFNAILSTQVKTEKEVSESLGDVKNRSERKELITEVSKEKFFDLVKTAGDS
ncbi:ribosomal RNA-processing protein 15 [Kluyveromyces marxianus DMKU3-1042]|uniref:Ribosomal RNA-processing protein 15 n=1 Tax=Kluyveromyces marxianus (strain DMKU3-1042 / BCC 29191 / NBRC 104275) TaxID=1003335 RepID=W0TEQ6_KLUMD|nr:ribosomal RNA-processing protein 15 [Kluyveromyces marxianus DMKU3-1042]BAO42132.1 ribosomal RNA-processing protein 15 [Kluyveromyces marxianus DMKU3-1042]